MGVPEMVMAEPGLSVWPAMTKSDAELAVYVWPPKVKALGAGSPVAGMRGIVDVPATR